MSCGIDLWMKVHVQISKRSTISKLWKLKMAD